MLDRWMTHGSRRTALAGRDHIVRSRVQVLDIAGVVVARHADDQRARQRRELLLGERVLVGVAPRRDLRLPPEARRPLAFLGGASSNLGIPTSSLRKNDGRDRYRERYSDPTRSRLRRAVQRETRRWRH